MAARCKGRRDRHILSGHEEAIHAVFIRRNGGTIIGNLLHQIVLIGLYVQRNGFIRLEFRLIPLQHHRAVFAAGNLHLIIQIQGHRRGLLVIAGLTRFDSVSRRRRQLPFNVTKNRHILGRSFPSGVLADANLLPGAFLRRRQHTRARIVFVVNILPDNRDIRIIHFRAGQRDADALIRRGQDAAIVYRGHRVCSSRVAPRFKLDIDAAAQAIGTRDFNRHLNRLALSNCY